MNIPVYNGERYLCETIESVLNQTYRNFEIIAVNDGSTDGSLELLEAYQARVPEKITVISQPNRGLSATRNVALKASSGAYIALLDQDDLWETDKLEKQIHLMEADQATALVFSDCRHIDESSQRCESSFAKYPIPSGDTYVGLVCGDFIPCPTILFRKRVVDLVGLFREDLKVAEDYEFLLRIAAQFKLSWISEPLAAYRIHPDRTTGKDRLRDTLEVVQTVVEAIKRYPDRAKQQKLRVVWRVLKQHGKLCFYYAERSAFRLAIHSALAGGRLSGSLLFPTC